MRRALLPLALVALLGLPACSGAAGEQTRPQVASGAYPFSWLVEQVGGPDVQLLDLVQPGVEPHDVELGPRQVADVERAELVVGVEGFQPALDDAVRPEQFLDLGAAVGQLPAASDLGDEEHGGLDPHVWLDPARMAAAATVLGDRLARVSPDAAEDVRARARTVAQQLQALDRELATGLEACERRDLVTAHAAFGYLATRYDLRQVGITGLSPDAEPSPGRLAEVARYARDNGVRTVFFETLVDPSVARTLAAEVGARTAVLDPLESVAEGDDYLTVMRRNLATLQQGLGCA